MWSPPPPRLHLRRVAFATLLWGCSRAGVAAAQANGALAGRVTDAASAAPIVGASIAIDGRAAIRTDSGGRFTVAAVPRGRRAIRVARVGYAALDTAILVAPGQTVALELTLRATAVIDRVRVVGESEARALARGPLPVTVVDVQRLASRATDLNAVLDRVAGVRVRQSGGVGSTATINVRGLEGKRVQIFIDGNPLNAPDGSFGINDIPVQLIERVEIYRGIVPAKFGGQGLGGAVNVVTREGARSYVDASLTEQTHGVHQGTLIGKKFAGDGRFSVGAAVLGTSAQNDYVMESPFQPGLMIRRDHDRYRSLLVGTALRAYDAYFDKIELEMVALAGERQVQGVQRNVQHAETIHRARVAALRVEKAGFVSSRLGLDQSVAAGGGWGRVIDTSSFRFDFDGTSYPSPNRRGEIGAYPRLSRDGSWFLADRTDLSWQIHPRHLLTLHANARYAENRPEDTLANRFAGRNVSAYPASLTSVQSSLTHEFGSASDRVAAMTSVRLNTFGSRSTASPLFTLTQAGEPPSFRVSTHAIGFSESARVRFGERWYVKGTVERAIRPPDAAELFGDGSLVAPAPALEPERSWNASVGVSFDHAESDGRRWQAEANAFVLRVSDFITLAGFGFTRAYVNTGEARIAGVDADIRLDATPTVFVYGNATWQDARDVALRLPGSSVTNPTLGLRIPNMPWLFGTLGGEWRPVRGLARDTKFFYEATYTHRYYYAFQVSENQDRSLPSSLVHVAGLERAILAPGLTLSFTAHNLAGTRVINVFNNPLPGRTLALKLRYTRTENTK